MLWWEIFGINFLEFGVMYRGKLVNGCLFFVFSDVIDKYSVKIVQLKLEKVEILDYILVLKVY